MRSPPARLTFACGILALILTLATGLNAAERGLGTIVGAGASPSVAYFSRCGPGTYDLAMLGQHRRVALVLPLGHIDAAGRVIRLSGGRRSIAINLAPTALRAGDIDRALTVARDTLARLTGGAGQVIRNWLRRVKS